MFSRVALTRFPTASLSFLLLGMRCFSKTPMLAKKPEKERDLFTLASPETESDIDFIPFQKKEYNTKRKVREAKLATISPGPVVQPPAAQPFAQLHQTAHRVSSKEQWRNLPEWAKRDTTIKRKIGGGPWKPTNKVSRDTMEGIRAFKTQFPHSDNQKIGQLFKLSPESVRRILKSNWKPTGDEEIKLAARWEKRRSVLETKAIEKVIQQREAERLQEEEIPAFREVDLKKLSVFKNRKY
ncbi:hypothetical protein BABINDRAFT_162157 [Babjeviella inositovora NRRL Y-12698]|uniref:Required for respiratory growth protein 9, mitochondrial n=1 Tax=Babjeviella inositovora NRRL Y-12698 TaxID=984486 RepID=A0A1E3QPU4_9ASCO|nr:uncharacterized protein BABINDRAFT_162157 [Babjeviella inositovora NRRL Y-12698]ODQ79092.1 hypothetical protein BABINDRAFT_162157 [Babjeviella inositovora NRRL Y-12698]